MLRFLLRRLFWLFPTLLLISTVLFLVSKLLPGYAGLNLAGADSESSYRQSSFREQESMQRQHLARTGQNLPYFYFSLRAAVESDTLDRVFNEKDREALHFLTLRYGNWSQISQFYQEVFLLQEQVHRLPRSPGKNKLIYLGDQLLPATVNSGFGTVFQAFRLQAAPFPIHLGLVAQMDRTNKAFEEIQRNAVPEKKYLPVVRWHGTENQYHAWLRNLSLGSLGTSFRDQRPVTTILAEAMGNTFWLMMGGFALTFLLALAVSLFLSHRQHAPWAKPVFTLLYIIDSIPLFLLALILLMLGLNIGVFSNASVGVVALLEDDVSWLVVWQNKLQALILPLVCIVLASLPYVTSQIYSGLQLTLSTPFLVAARAKGLSERKLLWKHSLRNSLLPIITLVSDFLPTLVTGALVLEVIFAVPGVGRLLADSVMARDYPVIMGVVILISLVRVFAHILADALYHFADPRIKEAA